MPTSLQYRRLRAPTENGQTLQDPPLESAGQLLRENLQADNADALIGDIRLGQLKQHGRQEVFELACQHTATYRDVSEFTPHFQNHRPIVMSGHQPRLFHPGVWYKNFCLSELGQSLQATAINVIVDNDICGVAAIGVPELSNGPAAIKMVHFDEVGDNVPFESRPIEDDEVFGSFGNRVKQAISTFVEKPIVENLWKQTMRFRSPEMRMGEVLAIGRHALELDYGLKTLEVPLSQIAQSQTFAHFAFQILERREEFLEIYNRALLEYRQLHKIRSNAHPVPPLEMDDGWCEVPLWIWEVKQPIRSRLFAKANAQQIEITNRRGVRLTIEKKHFVEQFSQLTGTGVAIRPRALATTMYNRLVLSDLFLHGIGGAKYDQLTDVIAEEFFGIGLPGFITLTATMKLPLSYEPVIPADITSIDHRLRELTFHPEKYVTEPADQLEAIVKRKEEWVHRQVGKSERLERHRAIVQCNELMQPFVQSLRLDLERQREKLSSEIRNSKILGSREFSFCLFPCELMDELKESAN